MKQNVFVEDLHMETQTVFHANGNININPCCFELGNNIVSGADRIVQRGWMVTEDDGTSHFRPYAQGCGRRYRTLYSTPHGEVKETKSTIIFQLRFPKKMGKALVEALYHEESDEQGAYIKTRRTETQW